MQTEEQKQIYLDHAATTPVDPRVLRVMLPFFSEHFGNPGSLHKQGVEAKQAVRSARRATARFLGAHEDEVVFTSGGTEGNTLAIRGVIERKHEEGISYKNMHCVTSTIEHVSVLAHMKELERRGVSVSYIPVLSNGIVDVKEMGKAPRAEMVLVSIMYANNEIGTIQPIREIAKIIKKHPRAIFHCDASQAPLYLDCNANRLGVDLMTLDAHKIYGPKGIGALYVRRGLEFSPLFLGGGHEGGRRSGTENVPGIFGLSKALEIAADEREKESARLAVLRDLLIEEIATRIPSARLNGAAKERLPNNVNFSFPGIESEWFVAQLDARGISASGRSACLTEKEKGSYVVRALGSSALPLNSVRFTLGRLTTENEIRRVATEVIDIAA